VEIYRKLNWNKKLQGNTVLQRCGAHTLYYRFVPSKLKMQTNVPEHIFNKNGWSHRHDLFIVTCSCRTKSWISRLSYLHIIVAGGEFREDVGKTKFLVTDIMLRL